MRKSPECAWKPAQMLMIRIRRYKDAVSAGARE